MKFGDYRVEIIPDCEFRLDGGAMFGVVPRNLWAKVAPPDEQNRIRMNMNCLFIEGAGEKILIDTGIGDKWSDKHRAMYGIERQRSFDDSLKAIAGVSSSDISVVINTHLHFDHAGGNTRLDESGKAIPSFPNARYFVSRAEYEHAEAPSERDRASYFADNWRPVEASGQLELKGGDYAVIPGLRMETHAG
ncbi:MAG TPA: MBL fold metallo-hydrolase, partial [Pyrinomonadaceae bacterium]|nr:MBL fold metallo-hydrolase [Pyrinomonadaceae bacterium]